jgi:hypothetical protein
MIKQPTLIRDRVLSEAIRMCRTMMITIGTYYPDEQAILAVLEQRGDEDLAAAIANTVMERFGAEPSRVKDPRFDKTHRQLAKKNPKAPRGANTFDSGKDRKKAVAAHGLTSTLSGDLK